MLRSRPLARRASIAPVLLLALPFVSSGCRSYTPAPLGLEAYRDDFLRRALAPTPPEVGRDGFDVADGLDEAEAQAVAMVFNAELRSARLRAGITRATAENAGLWSDPVLGVDLSRIVENVSNPWKVFGMVELTIPISGRLEVEQARADRALVAEIARVAELEWRVRFEVRRAWAERSVLEARIRTNRAFAEEYDRVLAVVELLGRAGELPRAEERLFRIRRSGLDLDRTILEARLVENDLHIRRLLGLPPAAEIGVVIAALGPPDFGGVPTSIEDASTWLLAASPLLTSYRTAYEVAEKDYELEIRRQYPDLKIAPGFGSDQGDDEVLLGLALPIPILNANRQAIAEAEAARSLARSEAERALEGLVADYAAALARLRAAELRARTVASELMPLVSMQLEDARRLAGLGEFDALLLLDTLDRQQEVETARIDADAEGCFARLRLEELLGPEPILSEGNRS